jgi:hypothetical protein
LPARASATTLLTSPKYEPGSVALSVGNAERFSHTPSLFSSISASSRHVNGAVPHAVSSAWAYAPAISAWSWKFDVSVLSR